jgi:hypothetical protein
MTARAAAVALIAACSAWQPVGAEGSSTACAPTNFAALASWDGVWAAEGMDAAEQGLSGRSGVADYKMLGLGAPWNDEGWGRMAAVLQGANNVEQGGWGYPMMMNSFSEFMFVISPGQTAIINQYREVRTIYTDGRGHVPEDEAWATNWGDSTGCWEGDTLVIDTVGVRFDPEFNLAAPPLSDKAHFVERLRRVSPDRIENIMTITDPMFLEAPWTLRLVYKPAGIDRLVLDANQDRNDTQAGTITPLARQELQPLPIPKGASVSVAELDKVAGRYALVGTPVEMVFERRGERLYFQPPGLDGFIPMIAEGPLSFIPLAGGTMRFTSDEAGKVVRVEATQPDGTKATLMRKL